MKSGSYTFRVRGARGTMACSGKQFLRHGGNTSCFSLQTPDGILLVDAGTGISSVAAELAGSEAMPPVLLLFTHFHIDHVIGLPVFAPLYRRGAQVTLMGDPRREGDWKTSLQRLVSRPYWPVGLGDGNRALKLEDLPVADGSLSCMGIKVSWFAVPHPQGCLAYRLDFNGTSIVISTDTEYTKGNVDEGFLSFCAGADSLIFDAQFTPEEYPSHAGWGHSTWEVAAEIAARAGVGRLVLTHHAPARTDRELDGIVRATKRLFSRTEAAIEGMTLGSPARRKAAAPARPHRKT